MSKIDSRNAFVYTEYAQAAGSKRVDYAGMPLKNNISNSHASERQKVPTLFASRTSQSDPNAALRQYAGTGRWISPNFILEASVSSSASRKLESPHMDRQSRLEAVAMSVRFWTKNPRGLLYAFEQGIYDKEIVTWTQDANQEFLHKSEFLKDKAIMRPRVYSDALVFAIIRAGSEPITAQLYGMFQASMIQSFLSHLADKFTLADASAKFKESDGDLADVDSPRLGLKTLRPAEFSIVARAPKLSRVS